MTSDIAPVRPRRTDAHAFRSFLSDTRVMTRRNLRHIVRTPQLIAFAAIQPVLFVLLFRYVFGGSIRVPGYSGYVDYLMPGIIVQTSLFGGASSAIGVAHDLSKGITDRFRSLPMHRGAILTGRTTADLIRNCFTVTLMLGVGLMVGFRFHNGFLASVGGLLIALFFGYAFSWVFSLIGMVVADPETAQMASFLPVFPLVFAASTFASTSTMPDWLRAFADVQPVTIVVNAARELMEGTGSPGRSSLLALAWCLGLLAIFAPLAVRKFRRL